ncbi:MAG: transposase [Lachnospiraceae bacterium]|nr:transposase [Lachnospiraceae bacterium]
MSRKPDPEAQYRIAIHVDKGYRYASTQPAFVDPESGKRAYRRIHWGTVDDNNRFIPGKAYIFASIEERSKLIFPKDWDLSEIEKLSGNRKPGRPIIESQDDNRLYGDIWLLEKIAETTGIRKDLMKVFDGNKEMTDAVMTLAMYLLCGKDTYNQLASWQRIVKAPYAKVLTSPYITMLTQKISEQNRMDLLKLRSARLRSNELCAVDSTSRSAWGESLSDIRYGKNKDHLSLAQTLEVVVYTLDGHMPVYYRTFAGNTPDSRSLETILHDLEHAGFKDVVLITDRGYESIRNLEIYIDRKQPMIMGTKVGQKHVRKEIDAFGIFDHHPGGMEIDQKERIYYKQYDLEYQIEGRRDNVKQADMLKLNLYFDPMRRSSELLDLDIAVTTQQKALEKLLEEQLPLDDDATIRRAYCYYNLEYNETTRLLKTFSLDEKKIERKKREAGFFANTTLKINADPMIAQHHYRLRDEQEKYFSMMKGLMGADRQRNWSESGKTGRLFILFVAQILGCYLGNIRKTKLEGQFDSIADVLGEMRPIRYIEHPNTKGFITPFVGKQVDICEAFGFEIPEGCAPEYVVRKTTKGKRGRPRKNQLVVKE